MIYCEEPRRVQFFRFDGSLYARSDGRVVSDPVDGQEATYVMEKGRLKVRTAKGKVDLAKTIVWSFTGYRPEAQDIAFRDGDPSNCRLGNLIIYEEGENRRKPDPIEVVGNGRSTVYFSREEACYCERLSIDQINYILKSPSQDVMGRRCRNLGIVSIKKVQR